MIYPREILNEIEKYMDSKEAIVITGMRRTGKTTVLSIIFDKIDSDNKIFIDLENPINRKYFEEDNYETIRKYFEFLGLNFDKRAYIFLDEIQFVRNIPSVVKYFIDHYGVKFFLTGSASFYLKNLFSESLAGRKFIFELFPLSFKEFLIFNEVKFNIPESIENLTYQIYETILPYYNEYLRYGGFPEVVLKESREEKRKSIEDIFKSYYQIEVMGFGDFRKSAVIRDLILLLMQRIGEKVDINRISRELNISNKTLKEYLSFLEGTYFIYLVRPFSRGKDVEIRKMPKVYMCDTGILNNFVKVEQGKVFENAVFLALRKKGEVNYYQRKTGAEIDFIFNRKTAYEVKLKGDKTDLNRLHKLCNSLDIKNYYLITKTYSDNSKVLNPFILEEILSRSD